MKKLENEDELVQQITQHRKEGLSREDIAAEMAISFNDVKWLIKKYNIKKPRKNNDMIEATESIPLPLNYGIPLIDQAKDILKDRLVEDWRGYWLDGRPVNSAEIIQAAGLKYLDE